MGYGLLLMIEINFPPPLGQGGVGQKNIKHYPAIFYRAI